MPQTFGQKMISFFRDYTVQSIFVALQSTVIVYGVLITSLLLKMHGYPDEWDNFAWYLMFVRHAGVILFLIPAGWVWLTIWYDRSDRRHPLFFTISTGLAVLLLLHQFFSFCAVRTYRRTGERFLLDVSAAYQHRDIDAQDTTAMATRSRSELVDFPRSNRYPASGRALPDRVAMPLCCAKKMDLRNYPNKEAVWGLDQMTQEIQKHLDGMPDLPDQIVVILTWSDEEDQSVLKVFANTGAFFNSFVMKWLDKPFTLFLADVTADSPMSFGDFYERLLRTKFSECFHLVQGKAALRIHPMESIEEAERKFSESFGFGPR